MLVVRPNAALATLAQRANATTPKARENIAIGQDVRWDKMIRKQALADTPVKSHIPFHQWLIYWLRVLRVPTLHLKPSILNGGDSPLARLHPCIEFGDSSTLDSCSTNLGISNWSYWFTLRGWRHSVAPFVTATGDNQPCTSSSECNTEITKRSEINLITMHVRRRLTREACQEPLQFHVGGRWLFHRSGG